MKELTDLTSCQEFIAQQFFALAPTQLSGVDAVAADRIIVEIGRALFNLILADPIIICVNHLVCPPSFHLDWREGAISYRALCGKFAQGSKATAFLYEDSHQSQNSLDYVRWGRRHSIGLDLVWVETNVVPLILAGHIKPIAKRATKAVEQNRQLGAV
jgi:hypothetical protein